MLLYWFMQKYVQGTKTKIGSNNNFFFFFFEDKTTTTTKKRRALFIDSFNLFFKFVVVVVVVWKKNMAKSIKAYPIIYQQQGIKKNIC